MSRREQWRGGQHSPAWVRAQIAQLEQQVQSLQNETTMLRQILKNVSGGKDS